MKLNRRKFLKGILGVGATVGIISKMANASTIEIVHKPENTNTGEPVFMGIDPAKGDDSFIVHRVWISREQLESKFGIDERNRQFDNGLQAKLRGVLTKDSAKVTAEAISKAIDPKRLTIKTYS